jgi:hypothetical protein
VIGNCVTPLRNNVAWFKRLGSVIQTYATPHPGRVYDVMPLNLVLFSNSGGSKRQERSGVQWMRDNPILTKEHLFAALVATTTGRMAPFVTWSHFKRVVGGDIRTVSPIIFPNPNEIELFLEFMKKTCPKGTMTAFVSDQFKKSLPPCIQNVETYSCFLRRVQQELDRLYDSIVQSLEKEGTRESLVGIMESFLMSTCGDGGNLPFLASQIIYNLDEMIDLLPGKDWETVVMGFGSGEAMSWLLESDDETKMDYLKRLKAQVMNLDDEKLACLGLERMNKHGRCVNIYWAINGRYVGLHDMEHFVCKLWVIMVRIIGARPSKNPKLHRPHLHPLKVEVQDAESFYGTILLQIVQKATKVFETSTLKIPEYFERW